ncbi:MAG: MCP four helix bundle domain-containing protein [Candidatus Peribacteraceae bacterium]|nr:MCP four helix bundle domain-containing protein [Candidatus Peribacteraceae bacterium]
MVRWTIGRKLAASFLVLTILMAFMGFLGITSLAFLNSSSNEILERQQPILTTISEIKTDLLTSRLKISQYLRTGNMAHLIAVRNEMRDVNNSILFVEGEADEETLEILNEIKNSFISYKNLIDSLLSFYEKNPDETEIIDMKKSNLNSLMENALLIKLDSLYDTKNENIRELGELNKEVYENSFMMTTFLSLILVVIGLLISFLVSRNITIPLKEMAELIPRMVRGEFKKIRIKSRDEIGDLAFGFNKMADDLKKSRKELEKYSEGLEKEVTERTKELEKSKKELEEKVDELERFSKLTVGRELKMVEMKKKIRELEKQSKTKST